MLKDDVRHPGDRLPFIESKSVLWPAKFGFEGCFVGKLSFGYCLVFCDEYELINKTHVIDCVILCIYVTYV